MERKGRRHMVSMWEQRETKMNGPSKSETNNTRKVGEYSCGPGLVANRWVKINSYRVGIHARPSINWVSSTGIMCNHIILVGLGEHIQNVELTNLFNLWQTQIINQSQQNLWKLLSSFIHKASLKSSGKTTQMNPLWVSPPLFKNSSVFDRPFLGIFLLGAPLALFHQCISWF